jgi:glycyl-tRNA synthetase beta chain
MGADAGFMAQADLAAQLAKADLVTDMVGEFPELQGTMGKYYALNEGIDVVVAEAIEDHYKPKFAGDTLPRNGVGTVVALADKLETLVGMFGLGQKPTGDKDPFALRRHALGVLRIVMERAIPTSTDSLIDASFAAFPEGLLGDAHADLGVFLKERLKGLLRDQGFSTNEVEAVVAAEGGLSYVTAPKRLDAVRAFALLPEAASLAAANKRAGNILKKSTDFSASYSHAHFTDDAEIALANALEQVAPAAKADYDAGRYEASLLAFAKLREPVDAFFEKVMVNADDPAVRTNRLGLLATLHREMNRVADLSKLAA